MSKTSEAARRHAMSKQYRTPGHKGGIAKADYSKPCPGCERGIKKGDFVTKVELPDGSAWWHARCRQAEVKRLAVLDPDENTFAGQKASDFRRKSVRRE